MLRIACKKQREDRRTHKTEQNEMKKLKKKKKKKTGLRWKVFFIHSFIHSWIVFFFVSVHI